MVVIVVGGENPKTLVNSDSCSFLVLASLEPEQDTMNMAAIVTSNAEAIFILGRTLRIRGRRAGSVDDTTDAMRSVACICFVRLLVGEGGVVMEKSHYLRASPKLPFQMSGSSGGLDINRSSSLKLMNLMIDSTPSAVR